MNTPVSPLRRLSSFLTAALIMLVISACTQTSKEMNTLNNDSVDGIIGGRVTPPTHPLAKSVVLLFNKDLNQNICTATIIREDIAVTAAHCIEIARAESFELLFNTQSEPQGQRRPVTAARSLPSREMQQNEVRETFDVALVRFTGGLPKGYQPISVLPYDSLGVLKIGIPVILAGYGVDNLDSEAVQNTLRTTTVKLSNPRFTRTELALDQTKGAGACKGDSGGPAFVYIEGKYYFWGIASRGVTASGDLSDNCGEYSAYTNAVLLIPGIEEMLGIYPK